jgi:hypothetical protein
MNLTVARSAVGYGRAKTESVPRVEDGMTLKRPSDVHLWTITKNKANLWMIYG